MDLSAMFILEVVIVFSFIITSLFMFIPKKNEVVHKIFFALSIMLGILVTFISATSLPANMKLQTVACWMCLVPGAIAIIISVAKSKPNAFAKICSMLTTILGVLGYFFFG